MSMTRKDYEALAKALQAVPAETKEAQFTKSFVIGNITAVLQRDNAAFQPARFVAACHGLTNTPVSQPS